MVDHRKLVVTRRTGESLQIIDGAGVTTRVTVGDIRGRNVRIQVDAPTEVRVVRDNAIVKERVGLAARRMET